VNLTGTVIRDVVGGVILIEMRGLLTLATAPTARTMLLKCLAQGPDAVLVDVAGLQVESRSRLAVFPAALRSHGLPGVALALCGADVRLRGLIDARSLGDVAVFDTREQALAAIADAHIARPQRLTLRLGPTPDAPSAARRRLAEACAEWGIPDMIENAVIVVSELVSNAVQHAGTDIVVRAARRGDYLHVSVRDDDPTPPMAPDATAGPGSPLDERGRGLRLVGVHTAAWGSHVSADGKTVWATLRARFSG
jgi:anti-sigma regulatory factor (Ser/Thr protein kinase)/anti-anti-sigma regulatory factor